MRRLAILLLPCLLLGPAAPAAAPDVRRAVGEELARAGRAVPALGVHVVELAGGAVVASHRASEPLVPASNQKLVTTAAALVRLGPGYRFATPVGIRGEVREGVLHGDVAVIGGGDPNLSGRWFDGDQEALFRGWAERFGELGIERVEGDLILVDGLFDDLRTHPDWEREQLHKCYQAPISALTYNDNCVQIHAWPGAAVGDRLVLETVPQDLHAPLENRGRTVGQRSGHRLGVTRVAGEERIELWGGVLRGSRPLPAYVSVNDPARFFAANLVDVFERQGVRFHGGAYRSAALPGGDWRPVAVHRSLLLSAVEVINKYSHNPSAEVVFKLLGAELCGEGSWEGGRRAIEAFLVEEMGWAPGSFVVADGSGLSRRNRVTAAGMVELLRRLWFHPAGWELARSLPYSGEEGATLERRLDEPPYAGNVVAKTGTIRGVSALSGYAKGSSGRIYAFSILANGTSGAAGQRAQERILRALIDHG